MVGRNDPCPCGSGKKYKKCCFKQDQIERRVETEHRNVDEELGPDASIYKVWLGWRAARKVADFNFLFDLVQSGSHLSRSLGERSAFVADCSEGAADIPSGEPADFRHLSIYEGERAKLLQTLGQSDSATANIRCECIDFKRTERGWRLSGFAVVEVPKSAKRDINLDLFDQGP